MGVLGEVQPTDMINNSEKLFRAYLGELKTQVCTFQILALLVFVCFSFGIFGSVCFSTILT